jgi:tRNA (mo5U34)-methyltransferase
MGNMTTADAANPTHDAYRQATQLQVEKLLRGQHYHALQLPDGRVIPGMIGIEALEQRVASFPIPADLRGLRVLDVGAASGWNSFEMLRRGASVTAVDCVEFPELTTVRGLYNPTVEYLLLDVDELTPATVGTFDLVLFFGVLYHLRHPLLGLEKMCALTRQSAFIESYVSDPPGTVSDSCSLEFYETDQLGGQIDNWFGPTAKCLLALCRSAGFVRVKHEYTSNRRAGATCHRHWEPEPDEPGSPPVWLSSAVNNRTNDIYFHPGKDEYLCIYFRTPETGLTPDRMRIEVDGYGVNALTVVNSREDEWQVNSRLPPGLALGAHTVRLRTAGSRFRAEFGIFLIDSPDPSVGRRTALQHLPMPHRAAPNIFLVESNLSRSTVFNGHSSERLCCRFHTVEDALDRDTVFARLDEDEFTTPIFFVTNPGPGEWEANLSLPADLGNGNHTIRLRTREGAWSSPAQFSVQRAPGS